MSRAGAYRVGPKRIGIRARDVAGLIDPRSIQSGNPNRPNGEEAIAIPPLSDKEQQQILAAVEDARRHQAEILAQRGGRIFPNSAELIREEREKRAPSIARYAAPEA